MNARVEPQAVAAPVEPVRKAGKAATRRVRTSAPVLVEVVGARAAARPWWFALPGAMLACLHLALLPLRVLVWVAELAVAGALIAAGVVVYLWWSGEITDAQVADALGQTGDRILGILQSAGIF